MYIYTWRFGEVSANFLEAVMYRYTCFFGRCDQISKSSCMPIHVFFSRFPEKSHVQEQMILLADVVRFQIFIYTCTWFFSQDVIFLADVSDQISKPPRIPIHGFFARLTNFLKKLMYRYTWFFCQLFDQVSKPLCMSTHDFFPD